MCHLLIAVLLLAFLPARAQTSQADFMRLDMRHGLPESRVRNLGQTPDGRLVVVTAGTICLYDGTRFKVFNLQPKYGYALADYHGKRHLKCDSMGMVWLRNDHSVFVIDTRRDMMVKNVDSLLADRGLSAGQISKWDNESTQEKTEKARIQALVGEEVSAVCRDCYGGLWVGLKTNGLLYYNPRRRGQFLTSDRPFEFECQYPFCSPRASELSAQFAPSATNCTLDGRDMAYTFLGTREGIMVVDRHAQLVGVIDQHYGLSTNNITSLLRDHHGDVWAATANGLTRLHQTGRDSFDIVNYGPLDGIDTRGREFGTCQIHRDASGLITVGFAGGTCVFHPDSVDAPRFTFHFPRVQNADASPSALHWWCQWLLVALIVALASWASVALAKRRWQRQETQRRKSEAVNMASDVTQHLADEYRQPSADELFLDKLHDTIERHLADEDFSVQTLSEMMAMDRSVLYRRMQSLTGVSPSVYIKGIRMSVAQRLLHDTDMSMGDIAAKTGFSTTKYFTSSFKEHFGMTPAEYREQRPGA